MIRTIFLFMTALLMIISSCKKKEIVNNNNSNNNTPKDTIDFRDAIVGKYSCYTHYYKHNVWMDSTGNFKDSYWDSVVNSPLVTFEFVKDNLSGDKINCQGYLFYPLSGNKNSFRLEGDIISPPSKAIDFDTSNNVVRYLYSAMYTKWGGSTTCTYIGNKIP
ncbi:MAG: hypothetical protein U0T32_14590 [Chitinophagales bacterium]